MTPQDQAVIASQIIKASELVAVAFSQRGTIVYASPLFSTLFDARPSSHNFTKVLDIHVAPEDRPRAREHFEGDAAGLSGGSLQILMKTSDGRDLVIRWSQTVQINLDGRIIHLASGVDVTPQIAGEKQAAAERARLAEAQRVAKIGSWELDLQTGDLSWSDQVYRIFEINPFDASPSYEAFLNWVHPDDRLAVKRAYEGAVRPMLTSLVWTALDWQGDWANDWSGTVLCSAC